MQCPTNASARPSTILTNTTVSTWVSDTSQSGYSYHADITHPDITVDMPASVIFSPTDASSGNYAPICQTGTGYVRIFSKVNTSITIPTIKIEGAINYYELQGTVGSDDKPIKVVNGQAVEVADTLQKSIVVTHSSVTNVSVPHSSSTLIANPSISAGTYIVNVKFSSSGYGSSSGFFTSVNNINYGTFPFISGMTPIGTITCIVQASSGGNIPMRVTQYSGSTQSYSAEYWLIKIA